MTLVLKCQPLRQMFCEEDGEVRGASARWRLLRVEDARVLKNTAGWRSLAVIRSRHVWLWKPTSFLKVFFCPQT